MIRGAELRLQGSATFPGCAATASTRVVRSRAGRAAFFVLLCILLFIGGSQCANAQSREVAPNASDSLAATPPMGWASWNRYFCDYDENTIREQADALVASGMRNAGYKYVIIQECIASARDAQGNLVVDRQRFPSGMPALIAYIHALGLKAGIYTDIGRNTCYPDPHFQGSYEHEQQDANTFASWGIDLVEMDYCNRVEEHTGRWVYERMADAIKNTARPMLFYLCSWGNEQPWEWAQGKAQMWRTDLDISFEKNHVEWNRVVRNFASNAAHSVFSAPNSWNDADMLEIGNPGLSETEARAQMSMWAISPSPLLAGTDLAHMSAEIREIYTNAEVIAINQDPLGAGAEKIASPGPGLEVWAKPLGARTSGEYAVMLLNLSEHPQSIGVRWNELELLSPVSVRNVWVHKNVLTPDDGYRALVPAHGAVLVRVKGTRSWKNGVVYEAEWPGIARLGKTTLLPCGECSRGYAIGIGDNTAAGSIRIPGIRVPANGRFVLRIQYVRNGLADQELGVEINGSKISVQVPMRSWNWVDVPVFLRTGENVIALSYDGERALYIDHLTVLRQQ